MTFVEQLIQKKKDGRSYAILALIWGGVIVLSVGALLLMMTIAANIGMSPTSPLMLWMILTGVIIFGGNWLSKTQFVEFEYSVYDGDLDIDQIIGKSRRKRIVQVPARRIETLEPCTEAVLSRPFDRTVMAAPSVAEATWCVTYHSKKNGNTLVLFAPNERTFDTLYNGLPRSVRIDCDRKRREAGL